MTQTVIGIHNALAAIKAAGWDQVQDSNGETFLVEDIANDSATDDLTSEYLVDATDVTRLHNGYMQEVIWSRVNNESLTIADYRAMIQRVRVALNGADLQVGSELDTLRDELNTTVWD